MYSNEQRPPDSSGGRFLFFAATLFVCHLLTLGWQGLEGFAETLGLPALRSSSPGNPTLIFSRDEALADQHQIRRRTFLEQIA